MQVYRRDITDAWTDWFKGHDQGYFITINSKIRVDGIKDSKLTSKQIDFEGQVDRIVRNINEYCYGRKFKRDDAKLKCLAGYEVGGFDGLIHVHLIAAHTGTTNRTPIDVERMLFRKWSREYQISNSNSFINVVEIDSIKDRIWYVTKQTNLIEKLHSLNNMRLH